MKQNKELRVVECPYCYAGWTAEVQQGEAVFRSSLRPCLLPQAADEYRRRQIYQNAGFEAEFCRIDQTDWRDRKSVV